MITVIFFIGHAQGRLFLSFNYGWKWLKFDHFDIFYKFLPVIRIFDLGVFEMSVSKHGFIFQILFCKLLILLRWVDVGLFVFLLSVRLFHEFFFLEIFVIYLSLRIDLFEIKLNICASYDDTIGDVLAFGLTFEVLLSDFDIGLDGIGLIDFTYVLIEFV